MDQIFKPFLSGTTPLPPKLNVNVIWNALAPMDERNQTPNVTFGNTRAKTLRFGGAGVQHSPCCRAWIFCPSTVVLVHYCSCCVHSTILLIVHYWISGIWPYGAMDFKPYGELLCKSGSFVYYIIIIINHIWSIWYMSKPYMINIMDLFGIWVHYCIANDWWLYLPPTVATTMILIHWCIPCGRLSAWFPWNG